jgi:uncharacterized protein (DUF885 family)
MKTFLSLLSLIGMVIFTSCSNNNNSKESNTNKNDTVSQTPDTNNTAQAKKSGTSNDVVTGYLNLKNALTKDNGQEAASAAKEISAALTNLEESALTPEQKKVYDDIKDDIKEHAEHIEASGSNIKHQREHFDLLSQDMIDLVEATGSSKTLYKDFCPMYNSKKGAPWLSETKEIKNPYYGKEMPKCGEVKEEIKPKG